MLNLKGDAPGSTPMVQGEGTPTNLNVSVVDDDASDNDIAHEVGHQLGLDHQDVSDEEIAAALNQAGGDRKEAEKNLDELVKSLANNLLYPTGKTTTFPIEGEAAIEVDQKRGTDLDRTQRDSTQLETVHDRASDPENLPLERLYWTFAKCAGPLDAPMAEMVRQGQWRC